jgi:hypothetical protein
MEKTPLYGRCVRCVSFVKGHKKLHGYCSGNFQAFKEVRGKKWVAGAPEGPTFEVRKLDGCSFWQAAW